MSQRREECLTPFGIQIPSTTAPGESLGNPYEPGG